MKLHGTSSSVLHYPISTDSVTSQEHRKVSTGFISCTATVKLLNVKNGHLGKRLAGQIQSCILSEELIQKLSRLKRQLRSSGSDRKLALNSLPLKVRFILNSVSTFTFFQLTRCHTFRNGRTSG